MKKIGIITITGGLNLGNSLQNYALQKFLCNMGLEAYTILNKKYCLLQPFSWREFFKYNTIKRVLAISFNINGYRSTLLEGLKIQENYLIFNKNIRFAKSFFKGDTFIELENFDFFIVGSDQVWNPNFKISENMFLSFTEDNKKISYAASFGCESLTEKQKLLFKNKLKSFKAISVREQKGKELLDDILPNKSIKVLVDPTLLISKKIWREVEIKPKWYIPKKYILTYFLGEVSNDLKRLIEEFAKNRKLEIINILDKNNNDWYKVGPGEFLYLIRMADYMITDSFHGTVFSIIMNKKFMVLKRKISREGNMISRIESLLNLFNLNNHLLNECNYGIICEILNYRDIDIDKILEKERKSAEDFLRKALEI